tara:strand:+ start:387 stop:764 length:378 start_codon:yes stop_codon:yes gene_type:complete
MSKAEMIEDIETLIRANKDNDYVGFDQLGDMIKEVIDDIRETPTDESLLRRLNRGVPTMKTYKVVTKWIGYSEYTVKANSKDEAEELCMEGSFDSEAYTNSGLDYGIDEEQVTETKIIKEADNDE